MSADLIVLGGLAAYAIIGFTVVLLCVRFAGLGLWDDGDLLVKWMLWPLVAVIAVAISARAALRTDAIEEERP